ncbi:glutathione hydrolase 1-like [Wolffia australiana]
MAAALIFFVLVLLRSSDGRNVDFSRHGVTSRNGVVAADDGRCSKIGRDVLREGGNAVDAAVATALCLGVVSPASSGIGGGAFLLLRLANGTALAFDMREVAPLRSSQNMYGGNPASKATGALSIAVPGLVAGLHRAWSEHGKLPWKRLVMPAVTLALNGFKISPYLYMQMVATQSAIFSDKGMTEIYTANGTLLRIGDLCRDERLAETLKLISDRGPETLYKGTVGLKLIGDIQKSGGILTMRDLQGYRVKVKKPISSRFMGLDLLGMPPPSSGGPGMMLVLNILAQFGLPAGISGSLGVHRIIESLKHMFAVRMNLGDPDFVDVSDVLRDMLSVDFAKKLKKNIADSRTFGPTHYGGRWNQVGDHGTSHLCIVDSLRNAVSMTTTVNSYFGSVIRSPSTGIILNNEMDDFSVPGNVSGNTRPPAPANFIRPLKRPLSSMTPTIVLQDGHLKGLVGASGGANIIAGTTEVFLNHFVKKMDPLSAVLSPRAYHQLIPNVLTYENWTTVYGAHFELPVRVQADLKKKGHVLQPLAGGTISQMIVYNFKKGSLTGVSDPRKGGFPAGY